MNEKFLEELRGFRQYLQEVGDDRSAKILDEILSRHEQERGDGLRERVAQITAHRACHNQEQDLPNGRVAGYCIVCGVPWPCQYCGPTPKPEVEPLACLAVRKNSWIAFSGKNMGGEYRIDIETMGKELSGESCFHAPTYPAAEQAARKFLEGLPDKGGK